MRKGNAVVGQSGGPTSVINSSLAGVMAAVKKQDKIDRLLGMHFGIEGLMKEDLWDLSAQSDSVIDGLRQTPSSALGSSRYKVQDCDFPVLLSEQNPCPMILSMKKGIMSLTNFSIILNH